jgi:hypothetical protein
VFARGASVSRKVDGQILVNQDLSEHRVWPLGKSDSRLEISAGFPGIRVRSLASTRTKPPPGDSAEESPIRSPFDRTTTQKNFWREKSALPQKICRSQILPQPALRALCIANQGFTKGAPRVACGAGAATVRLKRLSSSGFPGEEAALMERKRFAKTADQISQQHVVCRFPEGSHQTERNKPEVGMAINKSSDGHQWLQRKVKLADRVFHASALHNLQSQFG